MLPTWIPAYVALGSNQNQPRRQVLEACVRLAGLPDTLLLARSQLYLSAPMGPQDQPFFVNAVAGLLTRLAPRALLEKLIEVERVMGREREARWGPRLIDCDLLWMPGYELDEPGLTLPHPGVSERNFVLYPLNDIAPELEIPGKGRVAALKAQVGGDGISVLE